MLRRRHLPGPRSAPRPPILDRPRPFVIAHRGDSAHAPENTRLAFELALAAGTDAIETDLWLTADGELVCHHDATLERMTGDPRRIDALDFDALRRLTVRSPRFPDAPDQRIPSLAETLAWVPDSVLLVLEIKDPRIVEPAFARRLVAVIADRMAQRGVVAIAFDPALLAALRRIAPELALGRIVMRNPLPTAFTELLGVNYRLLQLNPLYVWLAHRRGRWVAPFDPDLDARLPRYLRIGVDAVLTNDPGRTRRRIAALRSARQEGG